MSSHRVNNNNNNNNKKLKLGTTILTATRSIHLLFAHPVAGSWYNTIPALSSLLHMNNTIWQRKHIHTCTHTQKEEKKRKTILFK